MLDTNEMLETYERLKVYPNLLAKVKDMLDLIEKRTVESVDDFEEALIPEVRKFGRELTQTWACTEERLMRDKLEADNEPHHSKKNCTGIPPLAE